ncbi:MAG: hypothetical protein ACHQ0J_10485 [Candidatus Dormibacterales bacterium]
MSPERGTLKYAVSGPIITSHALQRWVERVVPGASEGQAETQLLNFLELGEDLKEVPNWIRGSLFLGDQYIVCAAWPGVVLRVHDRDHRPVVLTVLVKP